MVAFVDESGQLGRTQSASPTFVLAGVAMPESHRPRAAAWLAEMRRDLKRGPNDEIHFKNIKSHADRMHVAEGLGKQGFARIISVVTCKHHLTKASPWDNDRTYLYALRYLMERMSWLARHKELDAHLTLAHVRGFEVAKLRAYEARLRGMPSTINWSNIDSEPTRIDRPAREEFLQIADIAASAIGAAFNPDHHGRTERRYLEMMAPRIDRGPSSGEITTYGLKMHPWDERTRAAYSWAAAL